ncbi:hypothetical protein RB195_012668 [Necator americanus]|uniref:Uncharacterized protein n=1 Tax=Necator americanus TaxID=51031 RepID=A0ABR1DSI6_NECAM
MQLFIAFLTALSSDGNSFDTTNATDQKAFTPLLTCIDEIQGVLQGVEYNQPSKIVDCGPTVTYCQKVTAHYRSFEVKERLNDLRGPADVSKRRMS